MILKRNEKGGSFESGRNGGEVLWRRSAGLVEYFHVRFYVGVVGGGGSPCDAGRHISVTVRAHERVMSFVIQLHQWPTYLKSMNFIC